MICSPLKYYLGDPIKNNEMGWACSAHGGGKRGDAYRVLVGKPEGKRPLGRPRLGWEDNFKMDLQEVGWRDMDWFDLAQNSYRWRALVNVVMNLQVP